MHANPELSFAEEQTTAFLVNELGKIPGLTLSRPTKTGVVATLRGGHPGRTIALRAACPGFFVELGARNEATGCTVPHHNSRYLMDEDALKYGTEYLYRLVRTRLAAE